MITGSGDATMHAVPRGFALVLNINHVISMVRKVGDNGILCLICYISHLKILCQHSLDRGEGQGHLYLTMI